MNIKIKKTLVNSKKYFSDIILIILGTAIMASATAFFLLPNKLSSGGFSGIATILYYLFNFPLGTTLLILNIPLFIIAFTKVKKSFAIKAVIGTAFLAIFVNIFEKFNAVTQDKLLACIYGGVLMGIGTAIILKANASTGGIDLLAQIVRNRKKTFGTGTLITIFDIIIVSLNIVFLKKIEIGLYSAITIYIMGKVIDIFFEGIYFTKLLYIVSEKHENISKRINEEIQRGTTGIYAKGMYTNKEKTLLLCAVSRNEISPIKKIIRQEDDKAFIIISNAREVFGQGFKKE